MSASSYMSINSSTKKADQEGTRRLFVVSTGQEAWLQERKQEGVHLDSCTKSTLGISILLVLAGTCCSWGYYIKERDQEWTLYALVAAILAMAAFIAQASLFCAMFRFSEQISDALCCLKIALIASANGEYSCKMGCVQCVLYTVIVLCLGPLPLVSGALMVVQAVTGASVTLAIITLVLHFASAFCGIGILLCLCAASSAISV